MYAQHHLSRRVPKVRDLHAVEPDGRCADVVRQVDHELQEQPGEARGLMRYPDKSEAFHSTNTGTRGKSGYNDERVQRFTAYGRTNGCERQTTTPAPTKGVLLVVS